MEIFKACISTTLITLIITAGAVLLSGETHPPKVFLSLILVLIANFIIWLPILFTTNWLFSLNKTLIIISSIISGLLTQALFIYLIFLLFTSPSSEIERELEQKSIEHSASFNIEGWEYMTGVVIVIWFLNGLFFTKFFNKPLTNKSTQTINP